VKSCLFGITNIGRVDKRRLQDAGGVNWERLPVLSGVVRGEKVISLSSQLLLRVLLLDLAAIPALAQTVEFNRDVRPILSNRCFMCHGPDVSHREAGIRFDIEGDAKRLRTELLSRIASANPDVQMPPPASGKPKLAEAEIAVLRQWFDEGAPWQPFWSFIPPKRTPGKTIDVFVAERLARERLHRSPEADPRLLLRRVSLDLTGLPPTPEELAVFAENPTPLAYEQAVDRLLASPRYGERMAFRWMEAARYGDTNGYQTDGPREMWRWRDWVIDAFNSNMPYDRFTVEQLAGDLIPNANLSQQIASGFNRNNRTSGEGGIIPEEYRSEYVADRAQTTATLWMGLTAGCARCHDHKYDPIYQKDFYRLYAYFNQIPNERGFAWNYGPEPPFVQAPLPDQAQQLAKLDLAVGTALKHWQVLQPALQKAQRNWQPTTNWTITEGQVFRAEAPGSYPGEPADFSYLDPFTFSAEIEPEGEDGAILTHVDDYLEGQGHSLLLLKGRVHFNLTHRYTDLGLRVETTEPLTLHQRHRVAVTYDGKRMASGIHIYVDGVSQPTTVLFDQNTEPFHKKNTPIRVGSGAGLKFIGEIRDARVYNRSLTAQEAAALSGDKKSLLDLTFLATAAPPEIREAQDALKNAQAARDKYYDRIPTVMTMADGAHRDTFLLKRGAYDAPGEKVTPGLPVVLNAPACADRLCLANWLVDRGNPLTARVTVNRIWASFFGTGIVKTVDDFGSQGEWPTHPELLDSLAVDFMESGWNLKALQKQIVMSATYRQSSVTTQEFRERDPENRLLARGPRIRLGPEVIRDQALAVSGLLVEKIGGPSVKPYQPAGLWQELSGNNGYVQSKGSDLYRRSLYTYWKRTIPAPYMMNFDSPNREQCAVFENRTNSPLQALDLMNEVTFLESARKLAERMMTQGGPTPESRAAFAFELLLARPPSSQQSSILVAALTKSLHDFAADPKEAAAYVHQGDSAIAPNVAIPELAAYMNLASLILNMDEAITKQ
jgi:hypothetical protein